jgi:adenylate kinase family enzyme
MKIHILGASGSGVTTLGKTLSQKLRVPYIDSDDFFWKKTDTPFTIREDPHERNAAMREVLHQHQDWIVGGSVIDWGENVFPTFDLFIFLWIPADIRIRRLQARELERFGDIILKNPVRKKQFDDFIEWVSAYDTPNGRAKRTRLAQERWLEKMSSPILRIIGATTVDERVQLALDTINNLSIIKHQVG